MLIGDVTLAVTVVLALGAVAALLLRRCSPVLRHGVWRATLAGAWLAPLAVVAAEMLPMDGPEIVVAVPGYNWAAAPMMTAATQPLSAGTHGPAGPAGSTLATQSAEGASPGLGHFSLLRMLLGLWSVGALIGLGALTRDGVALRDLLAGTEPASRERAEGIEAVAERLGVSSVPPICLCPEVTVPAIAGWLQPTLVLPTDGRLDEAALTHELAHAKRGDVPVLMCARVTAAIWWWHPLAWLMLRGLRTTAEGAADDCVVAVTGDRREYAQMLTDWAEMASAAGCVNCTSRGRSLVSRVRRLLANDYAPVVRLSVWQRAAIALYLTLLVGGGVGLRVQAVAQEVEGAPTLSHEARTVIEGLMAREQRLESMSGTIVISRTPMSDEQWQRLKQRVSEILRPDPDITKVWQFLRRGEKWWMERRTYRGDPQEGAEPTEVTVYFYDGERKVALYPEENRASIRLFPTSEARAAASVLGLGPGAQLWSQVLRAPDVQVDVLDEEHETGEKVVHVRGWGEFTETRLWVDPQRGYAVTRFEQGHGDGRTPVVDQYADLHEVAPGVWVPRRSVSTRYYFGPDSSEEPMLWGEWVHRISDLSVSESDPADEKFRIPEGTTVWEGGPDEGWTTYQQGPQESRNAGEARAEEGLAAAGEAAGADHVPEGLVRGLADRCRRAAQLAWRGNQTKRFDEDIQRARGRDTLSFTQHVAWAHKGARICAAARTVETIALDGGRTAPADHNGTKSDLLAAWETVAVFDGEATLVIYPPFGERTHGIVNIEPGHEGYPVGEFGRKMDLFDRSEWLVEAASDGKVTKCEKTDLRGTECWYVEVARDPDNDRDVITKLWMDPDQGYLAVREEFWTTDGHILFRFARSNVVRYADGAATVWLPMTVVSEIWRRNERWADRPYLTGELSVEDVSLQVADDDLFLDLTVDDLPGGYTVVDCR